MSCGNNGTLVYTIQITNVNTQQMDTQWLPKNYSGINVFSRRHSYTVTVKHPFHVSLPSSTAYRVLTGKPGHTPLQIML
jgi:hypothetical protein